MAGLRLERLQPHGLAPLHLRLEDGELVLVSGPSGSGKSLLLRAIADLDPHPGEAWVGGLARASLPAQEWRRRVGLPGARVAKARRAATGGEPLVGGAGRRPLPGPLIPSQRVDRTDGRARPPQRARLHG